MLNYAYRFLIAPLGIDFFSIGQVGSREVSANFLSLGIIGSKNRLNPFHLKNRVVRGIFLTIKNQ